MKNDTRISIFIGYGKAPNISRLSVCLGSLLVVGQAWAEVGLPPPAQHQGAGFPSEQALRQKGYDPKTGVWRVQSQNNGRPTVTKSGDSIKGTQSKTVTATGNYGEKATIRTTQTQSVSSSKLQNAANGLIAGNFIGGALKYSSPYIENATRALKNGNYGTAAHNLVMSGGAFLDGLLDGGLASVSQAIGRGLGTLPSDPSSGQLEQAAQQAAAAQAQAEKGGDLGGAIAAAAAQKAAEGAAEAAKQQEQWKKAKESQKENGLYPVNVIFREQSPTGKIYYSNKIYYSYLKNFNGNNNGVNQGGSAKIYLPGVQGDYVYYQFKDKNSSTVGVEASSTFKPDPQKTVENMTLNQKDIKDILERMLNNQQTNHAELMNQLSKIGDSVEKSTISNEFEPMTADSEPYTPQGSNTPQQTRFTINRDGSITTMIIPRPDLKPNSTLAPTRSVIIPTPNKGQNTPTTPNSPNTPTTPDSPNAPTTPNSPNTPIPPDTPTGQQNQENQKQDFCQQNPNAAQCMPSGDASYEDIQLPEQTIDLDFKPLNVFQSDGTCPAPRSVDFGALGQVEFSYDPLCDLARKLRPIFISICVLTCAYFVYESVKEL